MGGLEQGPFLLAPCLRLPICQKRLTNSIYFVIKRIKQINTSNMLRAVPGTCHKYLLLLLLLLLLSSLSLLLFLLLPITRDYDF